MFNSQLNKLKWGIKNCSEVTLKISSNFVGDSIEKIIFPQKLFLTNKQVLKLCKAFANGSSANTKLPKTQLHEIEQSKGCLGTLLVPLIKTGLPLIGNTLKPLIKGVLIPSELTATASATDAVNHNKMFESGHHLDLASRVITSIISSEEINDIMKIVKSFEESGVSKIGLSETIQNKAKKSKKADFWVRY